MSEIKTLCDFLEQTNNPYRIFDLGRRVSKISNEQFKAFENSEIAYPYPLQGHAWVGIVSWNPGNIDEQIVLFLKLPLDEKAGLVYAARDDLVYRMLKNIKDQLDAHQAGQTEMDDAMRNSPYGFTPNQERMAAFHAKSLDSMGQPASKYFQHALDYFNGTVGYDQWAFVGMQGIADVAARWQDGDNKAALIKAIPHLPEQPYEVLCKCLENEQIDITLSEPLLARFNGLLENAEANPLEISATLRALSDSQAKGRRHEALGALLASAHQNNLDLLVTIAGRCWEDLQDAALCQQYLEVLANSGHGAQIFSQILADLLYIPGMREPIMQQLRSSDKSLALDSMTAAMFGRR